VAEALEPALRHAAAEALEGAERRVFLVVRAARRGPEPRPGQADQPVEVAVPQPARRVVGLAAAQCTDPASHRASGIAPQWMVSRVHADLPRPWDRDYTARIRSGRGDSRRIAH